MLVLGRKIGEAVVIDGGRIRVEVCDIRAGGVVRLGIHAPPEVRIDRAEVHELRMRGEVEVEG